MGERPHLVATQHLPSAPITPKTQRTIERCHEQDHAVLAARDQFRAKAVENQPAAVERRGESRRFKYKLHHAELFIAVAVVNRSPSAEGSATRHSQQLQMIKSLTALAVFGLLGAAVVALPGFAPQLQAKEAVALAKGDRLPMQSADRNCSRQVWPNFDASCLRHDQAGASIQEARLVTARH